MMLLYVSFGFINAIAVNTISNCPHRRVDVIVAIQYAIIYGTIITGTIIEVLWGGLEEWLHWRRHAAVLIYIGVICLQSIPCLVFMIDIDDFCKPPISTKIKVFYWISIIINLVILTPAGFVYCFKEMKSWYGRVQRILASEQLEQNLFKVLNTSEGRDHLESALQFDKHVTIEDIPTYKILSTVQVAYMWKYFSWQVQKPELEYLSKKLKTRCEICEESFKEREVAFVIPKKLEFMHLNCFKCTSISEKQKIRKEIRLHSLWSFACQQFIQQGRKSPMKIERYWGIKKLDRDEQHLKEIERNEEFYYRIRAVLGNHGPSRPHPPQLPPAQDEAEAPIELQPLRPQPARN